MRPTRTILLIEDDHAVRQLLVMRLARFGYAVYPCASGAEAVGIVTGKVVAIDLLLTDLVMPGMTGVEASERIAETLPDLPVVFMSGYSRDDTRVALGDGARRYFVEKPFTADALRAVLSRAFEEVSSPRDPHTPPEADQ